MKVFAIQGGFGLDMLTPADRPDPKPGPGQVVLKMRAVTLNYRDLLVAKGLYNPKMPLPRIPCSDGVGIVAEVGEGVTRVKVGDRVAGTFFQGWVEGPPSEAKTRSALGGGVDGMLAEYVALDQEGVVHVPEHLDDAQAASLPCAGLTAWNALFESGSLKPGETVLTLGTGGVSIFALQFAAAAGARVIITSSSDDKLGRARELGAAETINYRADLDWQEPARKLTGGVGVDHVVELGGAGTLDRSLRAVRMGGTISLIGVLAGLGEFNPMPILMKTARVQGIYVGSRLMFEAMNRAVALHQIRPVVDRVFPFAESKQALAYMEGQGHFGKIAIGFD
jgi:NADPH:quinone reductase-like Zn-dependent oxidoreductase